MPNTVAGDPIACAAWTRLATIMAPGTFNAVDESLLELYALGVSLMRRAQDEISSGPLGGIRGGKAPAEAGDGANRAGRRPPRIDPQERVRLAAPNSYGDPRTSKFGDLLGQARF